MGEWANGTGVRSVARAREIPLIQNIYNIICNEIAGRRGHGRVGLALLFHHKITYRVTRWLSAALAERKMSSSHMSKLRRPLNANCVCVCVGVCSRDSVPRCVFVWRRINYTYARVDERAYVCVCVCVFAPSS